MKRCRVPAPFFIFVRMTRSLAVKITFALLCSLMGLVFLYSGYTKLQPIEPFEYTFVDLGFDWKIAPLVARFMIGLEFLIGFLFIFSLYIRRFTIPLTVVTLSVFCIYLAIMLAKNGNNANCGCFGTALVMTPRQALVKNAVMLLACLLIYRFYEGFRYGRPGRWLMGLTVVSAFALPHILNYVDYSYSEAYLNKPDEAFRIEFDTLYQHATMHTPPPSLGKGRQIVAFMSLTCPHCRIAAKKMRLMKKRNPAIPIYFVLNGDTANLRPFFEDTGAENIPYCQLNGRAFVYLAGLSMPSIYMVHNSVVEHDVNYQELDQAEIEKWLATP